MTDDAELAAEIATEAGELLLTLRAAEQDRLWGRELGRRGDHAANLFILDRLAAARPGDAVLSEESADDPARVGAERVWIVDPLDGSKEYGWPDHVDWAVHVALWTAGRGLTAGAVAQPALGLVYSTNDVPVVSRAPLGRRRPRIVISGSRPPAFIGDAARTAGADLIRMGSAGAKAMAVVRGEADAYVHAGGQWEWDSAAPVAVASAAGLFCARIDGSDLEYNRPHPFMPDFVICRSDWADDLLAAIAVHAPTTTDTPRIAMARTYIRSLLSRDASHVRLAADARYVEDGRETASTAERIRDGIEYGRGVGTIRRIRDLSITESGHDVVARFLADTDRDGGLVTLEITQHFLIPGAEIDTITTTRRPLPNDGRTLR